MPHPLFFLQSRCTYASSGHALPGIETAVTCFKRFRWRFNRMGGSTHPRGASLRRDTFYPLLYSEFLAPLTGLLTHLVQLAGGTSFILNPTHNSVSCLIQTPARDSQSRILLCPLHDDGGVAVSLGNLDMASPLFCRYLVGSRPRQRGTEELGRGRAMGFKEERSSRRSSEH